MLEELHKLLLENLPITNVTFEKGKSISWNDITFILDPEHKYNIEELAPLLLPVLDIDLVNRLKTNDSELMLSLLLTPIITPLYTLLKCFNLPTQYADLAVLDYLERFVTGGEVFDFEVIKLLPEDEECKKIVIEWSRKRGFINLVFKKEPVSPINIAKKVDS